MTNEDINNKNNAIGEETAKAGTSSNDDEAPKASKGNRLSDVREECDALRELLDEETKSRIEAESMAQSLEEQLRMCEEELEEATKTEEKPSKTTDPPSTETATETATKRSKEW